jgi:regulator of cell morphogenesis and NO signaling
MNDTLRPTADDTLGDIVDVWPGAARILEEIGLDYCCGGRRRLDDACAAAGLDADDVLDALSTLDAGPGPAWSSMGPAQLVDHIEHTHHRFLRLELGRLDALVDKVVEAHGARHPELVDLRRTFSDLQDDLLPHLAKEEQVLFPMIRALTRATEAPDFHCGSISHPVSCMMLEHEHTGTLLSTIRSLTDDHTPPTEACRSYRALYTGLADLEEDTHLHIHKENNVLFPAVVELERRLGGQLVV